MNEYQPPKRVVIEENLGGAAGIGIGILLLALIFYLNREHAIAFLIALLDQGRKTTNEVYSDFLSRSIQSLSQRNIIFSIRSRSNQRNRSH